MAIEITVDPSITSSVRQVELEEALYTVRIRWNGRAGRWFMDLADEDGAALAGSLPIVISDGTSLTGHLKNRPGMPPGEFVAFDTTDSGADPGEDDLGTRVKLLYLTAAELAAAGVS